MKNKLTLLSAKSKSSGLIVAGLLFLFSLINVDAFAQKKTITGTITDETGAGLPGVNIIETGTTNGAFSDVDGKYSIQANPNSKLAFSFIGYNTATMVVGTQAIINISLMPDAKSLEELVVIGYGTVKRKDLTGAVGTVEMADLSKAPVRSFDEALAGRVAGVQVTSADGQPGSGVNIVIRGNNSVTQSNSPLYVIDGFLIENPENNAVNPADIESIDILKDASATAIYGARGANGVIIITTKKGKVGKPVFAFSGSIGIQDNINPIELMSPFEFLRYQIELNPAETSTPRSPTEIYLSEGKTLESYKTEQGIDWQKMTQRNAAIQNYNLSVSGGTKKLRYAVSGSTLNQDGILLNSNYTRYQGRVVLDYKLTNKVKIGVNTNYSNLGQTGINPGLSTNSATTNIMVSVWGSRPLYTNPADLDLLQDPDVNPANDYRVNPRINLTNIYRFNVTNNLSVNSYLEYQILKNLKFRTTFGTTLNRRTNNSFNNSNTQFGYVGSNNGVNGSITNANSNNLLNENTLTWNKKFSKKSKIDVLGGFTAQKNNSKSFGQQATQLPNEELGLDGLDQGVQIRVDTLQSVWTMSSFLARVNYNYDSKYLLTASIRADGSSKFPIDNHWGYFPSAAASWIFKNESFLKKSRVLSEGKLRVSYGVTGNNRVGDFDYLTRYFNPISATYTFNNAYQAGVIPTTLGNSQLKWESTEQVDAGLDLGFFSQRVIISADVYQKTTKDLLLDAQLPTSSGFTSAIKNIGSVENKGLELSLTTTNIERKNFTWNTSVNIAFNRNKLLALDEGQTTYESRLPWDNNWQSTTAYISKIGEPLGLMYGYKSLGTYKYADFDLNTTTNVYTLKANVATNGNTRANIQPGDVKYADISGPDGVPDGVINSNDYTVIGRGLPKHTGGFSNNFTYKNFDLNVFLQWSYGNDLLNANRVLFDGNRNGNQYLNQFATYADRWTPENSNSDIPRTKGYIGSAAGYASYLVEDGSYLRLKTVSLGYNIESGLIKKLRLKSAKVYLSAQNLLTWTKYSGSDPEVNTYNSALTSGFDFSSYPRSRTFVFGANITF